MTPAEYKALRQARAEREVDLGSLLVGAQIKDGYKQMREFTRMVQEESDALSQLSVDEKITIWDEDRAQRSQLMAEIEARRAAEAAQASDSTEVRP